jgi:hypothetical protein
MPLPSSRPRMSSLRLIRTKGVALAMALAGFACVAAFPGMNPAAAQDKPACEQFTWSIKREQALFGAADLRTVASGAMLDAVPERGIALELKPNASVAYVLPPERQPKLPDSSGGVVSAPVSKAGPYQVTTNAEAWLDVIQNGKPVASTAHSGRRDCADIRKSVRFDLEPGTVTIQLSGVDSKLIKLAVLPIE